MGLRRTLVKLFNLVYIAAAGVSIYSICTKNIVSATIKVDMNSQQVAKFIGSALKEKSTIREKEYTYSRIDEGTIKDWLTQEKIAKAFDKGLHLSTKVDIPFTKAFEFKNKNIVKEVAINNLDSLIDEALDYFTPAVRKLFKEGAEHYALETLTNEINDTIQDLFPEEISESVSTEQVQEIFDNVYSLVEGNSASLDQIAGAINGEGDAFGLSDILRERAESIGNYAKYEATPEEIAEQLTREDNEKTIYVLEYHVVRGMFVDNIKYYRYDSEQAKYIVIPDADAALINAELAKDESERQIYVFEGVVVHDPYSEETEYYKHYTNDRYNVESIANSMIDSLESVPGLVTRTGNYIACSPTKAQVEADIQKAAEAEADPDKTYNQIYYVKVEENYVKATAWDSETQYYKEDITVNDVNGALSLLLDEMLNGKKSDSSSNQSSEPQPAESSRTQVRESESEIKSEKEIRDVLAKYIDKYLPRAKIESFSASIGTKGPLILLGVLLVFLLPWAWFALVTLIRTLSPRKIWTRTGIIFFWAIPQVILGLVLTYGLKYGLQIAGDRIPLIKSIAEQIGLNIRFSCLIPSFIYLGMIPVTIIYLMLAHPFKVQYKFERRMDTYERHRAQREARRWRE